MIAEGDLQSAAAERLKAQSAAARKQIQHPRAFRGPLEHVEQRFPHDGPGWAGVPALRRKKPAGAVLPAG